MLCLTEQSCCSDHLFQEGFCRQENTLWHLQPKSFVHVDSCERPLAHLFFNDQQVTIKVEGVAHAHLSKRAYLIFQIHTPPQLYFYIFMLLN